jgi:hypothetical protein
MKIKSFVVTSAAVVCLVACGRIEFEESVWQRKPYPSQDKVWIAEVAERISGKDPQPDLMVTIYRGDGAHRSDEAIVYSGWRGQVCLVHWSGRRELTIRTPGMLSSTSSYGEVTVLFEDSGGRLSASSGLSVKERN